MTRHRGFTLIELMIVIAIIAIIAAIAIPNLIESRKASNEASAIQVLRAVHAAETLYRDRDMDHNDVQDYCIEFGKLEQAGAIRLPRNPTNPNEAAQNGYTFGLAPSFPPGPIAYGFRAFALPLQQGKSGDRIFCIDDGGVIRFTTTSVSTISVDTDTTRWTPVGG